MCKCPVCKAKINTNTQTCENCGFSEINVEFVNVEDAQHWENTVLKQCRNIYEKMAEKAIVDEACPTLPFDKPRRGCNVRIKDFTTSDVICGKIIGADRRTLYVRLPGKLKALVFDLAALVEQNAIEYLNDDDYQRDVEWDKSSSKMVDFSKPRPKEPFRRSYDDFVRKNINSRSWCCTEDVIYYNEIHQKANTYFCAYDNPPFEIVNTVTSKNGNQYTIKVSLRNLSNETRNKPIKFRYRICSPTMDTVHDWTDTVIPAPKYQTAVITFEYDGKEKPYFEIIN